MEIILLYYAVVIACVDGVCDEYIVAEKPTVLSECIEVARREKEKFLYLDKFASAICSPETEYN
jgi:hypothetical protein